MTTEMNTGISIELIQEIKGNQEIETSNNVQKNKVERNDATLLPNCKPFNGSEYSVLLI